MKITEEQQISLIKEVKFLIDENLNSPKVLERAESIATIVFGILNNSGDTDLLGFSLQEYAYECLEFSKGNVKATAWIEENDKKLDKAIAIKFSKDK